MTPPIILDIEASGFGVGSYPIEIGYADASGATWSAQVQPQADWLHWDHQAEKLHQQSRQELVQHGQTPHAIATYLNLTFTGQTLYTDGWYQDFVWLHSLYEAAGMNPSFKLEDLSVLLTTEQQSVWHDTKQSIRDTFALPEHRAAMDAKVLQLTWLRTIDLTPALVD
ncbi:MAG: hypothetical protein ACAH08_01435 [Methylophilus sp.]|uniref:hypothetical protein n=1 Tax=Methylophilus sp. TaxID=29541 RepID=UPI002BB45A6C|nr:hypothetical protein [Methylophilus sp.]HSH87736.1 hypothetical protein [Methylophilus sp.]